MSTEWLYRLSDRAILLVLLIVGVATSGASLIVNVGSGRLSDEWWEGWLQNFSTEMFGAFLGFWLLGMIVDRRRQREAKGEAQAALKQRLIREMRSKDNATALNAVEELDARGWLKDGSLQGVSLYGANLQGSRTLAFANLEKVKFWHADLRDTDMSYANLQMASLRGANLQGTNLGGVKLQGVQLIETVFDEETKLPDGTYWTPDTDMTRFTDPDHPDFWRVGDPDFPAYPSKSDT